MTQKTTEEWEAALGEQVRAVRIAAGHTQGELAELASVSPTSVRALERGAGSSLRTLIAVTRVLDRAQWLNEYDPRGTGPSPIERLREQRRQPSIPQRVRKSERG